MISLVTILLHVKVWGPSNRQWWEGATERVRAIIVVGSTSLCSPVGGGGGVVGMSKSDERDHTQHLPRLRCKKYDLA